MFWTDSLTGLKKMKAKGFFRKFNFLIALGGVFAAVAFYGCGNLFSSIDSASDSPANLVQPREGYGIVSGNLPSSDSASARTAMPSKPDETALSFKVFAQSGSQRIEANVNDADRTFSLSLPFGTWEITANGMLADGRILFTQTQTVTLSEENATAFLRFELGYSTNPDDGDGEISLSVSFPPKSDTSAIRGIEYVLSRGEEKIVQNVSDAELGEGNFKIGLATENLGAWHLTVLFYGDFSNLVYRIDQTVNVYANLTTDTFEGSAPYISGGAIVLTKVLLEDFQNTTLYVNATDGKDTNTGTQFDPLQTFNRALELVNHSTRDASTEFRIFLQTDIADGATLELNGGKKLTVASAGADGTTRTITSLGRTFTVSGTSELTVQSVACKKLRFDVSGTFAMDGGEISGNTASNGGAICINANGKATVANTKIYDNSASNKGGGVYVGGSAKATLTNCVIKSCETTVTTAGNGGGGIFSLGILTVTGGTISDCIAGRSGGGIYAYGGTVKCSDGVAFSNCEATGSGSVGSGGGICINKDVTVNVLDCTFVSCTANASGGGIWNAGELTVRNTSFDTCSANNNGGGICNDGGTVTMSGTAKITGNNASDGGGVAVNSGTFTLENGTISNNTADGSKGSGGGVYVYNGTFTMEGGEISDNTAKGVDGERFGGGGIYLYRMTTSMPGGTFTLKGGTVSGNKAKYGGGIWTSNFSEFTMSGGTFSGNKSTGNGNGAYVNPGCTFTMSGAAQFAEDNDIYLTDSLLTNWPTITVAGALTAESPVATITPSAYDLGRKLLSAGGGSVSAITPDICKQFTLTSAPDDDTVWKIAPSSDGANGVLKKKFDIYVRGNNATWYEANKPDATASDSNLGDLEHPFASIQMAVSEAISQNDGVDEYTIFVDGTVDGATPGAHLGADGMADFSALTQDLNLTIKARSETVKATLDGGARFDADGNTTNGGIGKRIINAAPTSGTLNLTLENLVITGGNASDAGGGVFVNTGVTFTMTSGEISRNRAANAGGVFVRGGGKFTMTGGSVSDNKSDTLGGGVYNSGTFEMSGTAKITGNKADGSGGGVFVLGGSKFTMDGGEISSNNTETYGGGVFVYPNGEFTMTGGTISNNTATINGGGVYINSGTFTMNGDTTKIKENTANGDGGGVYVASSTFTMEDGTISENEANYGGGVYVNGGTFTMKGSDSAITGNTARGKVQSGGLDGGGGGVYLNGATFEMSGGTISGNKAAGSLANSGGGGVYTFGVSAFTMTGGTVSGNTAQNAQGNGAFISPSGKLNMKGASKFQGDNDVYLFVYTGVTEADIPTICVTGSLSASSVATITPSDYVAGRQVLSKGGSVTEITQTICKKFALSPVPDGAEWKIVPNGTGANGVLTEYKRIYLNSSSGSDTNSGRTARKAVKTLSKAIELFEKYGSEKIMLCANYTLPIEESTLLDRAGKSKLTLVRYDGSSDDQDSFRDCLLTISQGDVAITNVTLDGNKENVDARSALLDIEGSTTVVTLGNGATLCNNKTYLTCGGVCITLNGTFKMTGGTIVGNDGPRGGVYIVNDSTFEMSGGKISGNTATDDGGGVYISTYCTFTQSGGEISGNTAADKGGGVYAYYGGFTQTGGTVSGNTPDNIYQ
ncbi:MAG: right-handed parallel beta-helix repeat-containing protein [Treponemataceae bacterium]|nr:right-handed parallel beta-helix repeat-containing protein [Treponemataceae bacterium]